MWIPSNSLAGRIDKTSRPRVILSALDESSFPRVAEVTAEPRMEELLASIRKAIHDDIGEVPASMSSRASGTLQRGTMRELHVKVGEEIASAATEIQQLREKINRSRTSDPLPVREPAVRAPSLAAALQAEQPRRSWRDIDPQPRLRSTIVDQDLAPPPRADYQPRHVPPPEPEPVRYTEPPRYSESVSSWQEEAVALPPPPQPQPQPRESYRTRADAGSILSGDSAQAVQAAFNRLADTVLSRATGDRSIEDLTRELLRGMLKQWLDDNLPGDGGTHGAGRNRTRGPQRAVKRSGCKPIH